MSNIFQDYSFGGWLKHFRIQRKITLRQASGLLDVDVGNLSRMERSMAAPPSSRMRLMEFVGPYALSEGELDLLMSAAFNYHLGKLRKKWDKP